MESVPGDTYQQLTNPVLRSNVCPELQFNHNHLPGATDYPRKKCRFIATVINYKPNRHWVAVVFDRLFGHLYILDTLGPSNKARARRAANITQAWRQFGTNLGFLTGIAGTLTPLPCR
ncbi:hypothetical protein V2G26_015707 [Clonostachys chloroleuca]